MTFISWEIKNFQVTFFQDITWIIAILYRAQQIIPLKGALINDKPAGVSISVMQ